MFFYIEQLYFIFKKNVRKNIKNQILNIFSLSFAVVYFLHYGYFLFFSRARIVNILYIYLTAYLFNYNIYFWLNFLVYGG